MLHELYLAHQQYKRASFCIEELILINPMNYIYHIRAGEISCACGPSRASASEPAPHSCPLSLAADRGVARARRYTLGMSERGGSHDVLLTARKYFAHALELKPGCLRALYGIILVCAALGASTKGKGTKVSHPAPLPVRRPRAAPQARGHPHPQPVRNPLQVDTAELLAFVEPQLVKAYTPSTGAAHPMRKLVMAMMKTLGSSSAGSTPAAGA